MKLKFRCYTCNIFKAIKLLQLLCTKDLYKAKYSRYKRIVFFMLPFSGVHSSQIRNKITSYFLRPIHMQRLSAFSALKTALSLYKIGYCL